MSTLIVWNVDVLVLSLMLSSCCNCYKCHSYYNYDDHGTCPCGVVQNHGSGRPGFVTMIMACVPVVLFRSWI